MAANGLSIMQTCVFVLALVTLGQALNMTQVLIPTGEFCAELSCYHTPSGNDSIAMSRVKNLTLDVWINRGRWDIVFTLTKDNKVIPKSGYKGLGLIAGTVDDDLIQYKVGISNTSYCKESVKYACFMNYDNSSYKLATAEVVGATPVSNMDDVSVAGAVIDIMSSLANELVWMDRTLTRRTVNVSAGIDNLESTINQKVGNFQTELTNQVQSLEDKSETLTSAREGDLAVAKRESNDTITTASGALQVEVCGVQSALIGFMDATATNLNKNLTSLKNNATNGIARNDKTNKKEISDLKNKFQLTINAFGNDVISFGNRTTDEIAGALNKLQGELSSTQSNANVKFGEIETTSANNYNTLESKFTSGVNDLQGALSASLKQTRQRQDSDIVAISASLDQETANMTQSLTNARSQLGNTVTSSQKNLEDAVTDVNNERESKLNSVQLDFAAHANYLKDIVARQEAAVTSNISNTSSELSSEINTAADNARNSSDTLNNAVLAEITKADSTLSSGSSSVDSDVVTLGNKTVARITSVESQTASSLNQANNTIIDQIISSNGAIVTEVDTFKDADVTSLESKFNETNTNIGTVQMDIVQSMGQLSQNIEREVTQFRDSTAVLLGQMEDAVTQNITSVNTEVDTVQSSSANQLQQLTQAAALQIQGVNSSISSNIRGLESNTNAGIKKLAQKVSRSVATLSSQLNNSVEVLASQSLQNLDSLKTDAQLQVNRLQSEANELLEQARSLGSEINTESSQVVALGAKFAQLTARLSQIDATLSQFQQTLSAYMKMNSKNFQDTSSLLSQDSKSTLALLGDVNTRIDTVRTNMRNALAAFQVSIYDMGQEIGETGANLTNVISTNIQDILEHLERTTEVIMSYLQPKRCERGMNYAAISNNQYVIITPNNQSAVKFEILCDTNTDGGGWIVIQRRAFNSVSFYKGWSDYREGFGSLDDDFYIGNDRIHELTANDEYELRVNLLWRKQEYFAEYDHFEIDSRENLYTLHVGNYTGNAGDSLSYQNGMAFSTYDFDNDFSRRTNCAKDNLGGWWYNDCFLSNLNGAWDGKSWHSLTGTDPAATTKMMIRLKK